MKRSRVLGTVIGACAAVAFGVASSVTGGEEHASDTGPWMRIKEDENRVVRLDVAARTFAPEDGKGPTVTLAGAVHVGERHFYQTLQAFMDAHDLVLYEGVKPPGFGDLPDDASRRQHVEHTKARLRLMAILVERTRDETGAYPASLEALRDAIAHHKRQAQWLETASVDAWSNEIRYEPPQDEGVRASYDLVSLGADGAPGGKGHDADLRFSAQDPLSESELGTAPGLQERLAETFRLRFQLDEMDESGPHWRNADMSVDQIQRRMGLSPDGDGEGVILFDLLDGSSSTAKMASAVLRLIENLPGAAPRGRLMIMEMLSMTDEQMLAASMPGGDDLLEVIIDERNQVVIDELERALRESPDLERIGIIYGAGHMPDLEERLMDQLGYAPTGETVWHTTMRLPLDRVGITPQERMMLRATLLRQIRDMKRMRAE